MVTIKIEEKNDSLAAWDEHGAKDQEHLHEAMDKILHAGPPPTIIKELVTGQECPKCVCHANSWEVIETGDTYTILRCSRCGGPGIGEQIDKIRKWMMDMGIYQEWNKVITSK